MKSHRGKKKLDDMIDTFNSTSRYLDGLLTYKYKEGSFKSSENIQRKEDVRDCTVSNN